MRTPAEAKMFLQELQQIMRALEVSDADMEKGQLRCDANISLRPIGHSQLHPKTEVKNINSFKFVEKALQYEIERQTKMWEAGDVPKQATRGFNSTTGKTTEQRTKEEAADYRYFPEPDIPPFIFIKEELQKIAAGVPELPANKQARFMDEYGLTGAQAQLFASDRAAADYFEATVSELEQMEKEQVAIPPGEVVSLVKLAINIITRELRTATHDRITPENFAELIVRLHRAQVPRAALAQMLAEMQRTGGDPDAIIVNLGIETVAGAGNLAKIVQEVIEENSDVVAKIKAGKESAINVLVGQVMAKTRGAGNPKEITDLLRKAI